MDGRQVAKGKRSVRGDEEPKVNKSLYKALRLLDCFTEERPDWSVTELSRELGIGKSSVSSMLSVLAHMDFVEQSPVTRRLQLGLRCLELGYVVSSRLVLRDYAYPYLEPLLGGNRIVYLGILYRDEVLYVEALFPPRRRINYSSVGRRAPLYCTAIGKAMLSAMPDDYLESYLDQVPREPATENTLVTAEALRADITATRQRGYATDLQEREPGIQCVGVPIRRGDGSLAAALSISGPASDVTTDAIPQLAEEALAASRDIGTKLTSVGY